MFFFPFHYFLGIIIKWAYQIEEVMSKDSDEALKVDGIYPGPMAEIKFWEAKHICRFRISF